MRYSMYPLSNLLFAAENALFLGQRMSVYTQIGEQETQTQTEACQADAHIQSAPIAFEEVAVIDLRLDGACEAETDGDAVIDHAGKVEVSAKEYIWFWEELTS